MLCYVIGKTALMYAARNGCTETVTTLIQLADVNIQDKVRLYYIKSIICYNYYNYVMIGW